MTEQAEQLERYWRDLINVGIRPYGSKGMERTRDVMLARAREFSPKAFTHDFAEPGWEAGDWSLEFTAPTGRPPGGFSSTGSNG